MKNIYVSILITFLTLACNGQDMNFLWAKDMGSSDDDSGYSVTTDGIGNVYTTGHFEGTVDFDPGPNVYNLTYAGFQDIFIQKLDSDGNFLWAKQMGGINGGQGRSITIDVNGNVCTIGYFNGTADFDPGAGIYNLTTEGSNDVFIQKLDSDGNFLWVKQIGGTDTDVGWSITTDTNGNIYFTGKFQGTIDLDPGTGVQNVTSEGTDDIFIHKLDSDGNLLWAKQIGGSSFDVGMSLSTDTSNNVCTSGFFNGTVDFDPGPALHNLTSMGSGDVFIQKMDSDGNFIWAKQIGGSNNDKGLSLATDDSNNVFTTGHFWETVDFDPGAGVQNLTSTGLRDLFVLKLDAEGNFLWAKQMGGTGNDWGFSLTTNSVGNVITTGVFEDTADFDPGAGVLNLTSAGSKDIFIQNLDSDGNFLWAKQMGGNGDDRGYGITTDNSDNVITTGNYNETVDFDPGTGVYNLTSEGLQEIFIQKLEITPLGIDDNLKDTTFLVYPNPTAGKFTISFESILTDVEVSIEDIQGRLIYLSRFKDAYTKNFEINNQAGVYIVKVKTLQSKKTMLLIKK